MHSGPKEGWWNARFRINWPEHSPPAWHVDLVLAHGVVAPVLDEYEDHLVLWRFHRRASRDRAGHSFRFIFYSGAEIARQVFDRIRSEDLLADLKAGGVIDRDSYDDTGEAVKPDIEDTSDPSWSPEMRKAWPYFIHGVSQAWLNMIARIAAQTGSESPADSLSTVLARYEQVNAVVQRVWQTEGQHALLHHLSAVFGYAPLVIPMRF